MRHATEHGQHSHHVTIFNRESDVAFWINAGKVHELQQVRFPDGTAGWKEKKPETLDLEKR